MSRCASKCPHLQLVVTHTAAIRGHCTYYSTDLKTNPYPQYRNSGPYRCDACVDQLPPRVKEPKPPKTTYRTVDFARFDPQPEMLVSFRTQGPSFDFSSFRRMFGLLMIPPPPPPPPVVPLSPPLTPPTTIDPVGPELKGHALAHQPCIIDPEDPEP